MGYKDFFHTYAYYTYIHVQHSVNLELLLFWYFLFKMVDPIHSVLEVLRPTLFQGWSCADLMTSWCDLSLF